MAKNKVNTSGMIPDNVFSNFQKEAKKTLEILDALKKGLISSAEAFEKLSKEAKVGDSKSVNELMTAYKGVNEAQKASNEILKTKRELTEIVSKEEKRYAEQISKLKSKEGKALAEASLIKSEIIRKNKEEAKSALGLVSPYQKASKELATLKKRYKDLAIQNKENTEVGKNLLKQITEQDKKLKEIDKSVGEGSRSVGLYTESIREAASASGFFGRELAILQRIQGTLTAILKTQTVATEVDTVAKKANAAATTKMTIAQRAYTFATNLGVKSLKAFKIALAATGIGAIILVIGSLITYLTQTQEGMDSVERAMKALTTTMSVLKDRLSGVGKGFKEIFSGDISKGVQTIKDSFKGIGDEVAREVKAMDTIVQKSQDLRIKAAQFIGEEAYIRAQIAKIRLFAEDEANAIDDRITKLKEAFKLEEELANKKASFIREQLIADIQGGKNAENREKTEALINDVINNRIKLTKENLGYSDSTTEDLENAYERIAELTEIQSEQYLRQRKLLSAIQALEKEREKPIEEVNGLIEKQTKLVENLLDKRKKATSEGEIALLQKEIEIEQKELERLQALGKATEDDVIARRVKAYQALILQRAKFESDGADKSIDERLKKEIEYADLSTDIRKEEAKEKIKDEEELTIVLKTIEEERINTILGLEKKAEEDKARQREEANKKEIEAAKKQAEMMEAVMEAVAESVDRNFDNKIQKIEKKISKIEERRNQLEEAAASGSKDAIDSLVLEAKQQAELELQAEKSRKRQVQAEAGLAAIRLVSSNALQGKSAKEALSDVGVIKAISAAIASGVPSFFDGTEDTGTVANPLDNKGGRIAVIHDNERIIPKKDNIELLKLGISTPELVDAAKLYALNQPSLTAMPVFAQIDNSKYFKELIDKVDSLPSRMPRVSLHYDEQNKAMVEVTRTEFKHMSKVSKVKGGVFS